MSNQSLNSPRAPDSAEQRDGPTEPPLGRSEYVQMTMAEWKKTHKDFKGSCIGSDGKHWGCVLRSGGMVRVDITKE